MNDYKELIEDLRRKGLQNGSVLGWHSGLIDNAADAIEQLVKYAEKCEKECEAAEKYIKKLEKDRDEWKTLGEIANKRAEDYRDMRRQRDEAIKERDTAIADISSLALKREFTFCDCCKNENSLKCVYCTDYLFTKPKFEWRGVQEEAK